MTISNRATTQLMQKIFCFLILAGCVIFLRPVPLPAQGFPTSHASKKHVQYNTMKGKVLVFTVRAITVQDEKNMYMVRTFSYDAKLLRRMQKRHYKWGDKVKVKYIHGSNTAVKVR